MAITIKSNAQTQVKGKPLSLVYNISNTDLQQIITNNLDMDNLNAEDKQDELNNNPPRFGFPQDVNINTTNSGTWLKINEETSIWRIKIKCPNALSINLLFSKFHLLPNTKMYIYSTESKQIQGAFTEINNKGTYDYPRKFGTGLYYNDEIIIELDVPTDNIGKDIFELAKVVHGYRDINIPNMDKKTRGTGFTSSGSCQVNINCPEGNDWQNEKKGVALILVDGSRWCSGSLINNTCNDAKLYFLTANHCLDGLDAISNNDASNWSFVWNYESKDCNTPQSEPTLFTTNGATVIANFKPTDFALLELTESPINQNYPVYFNGWSRTKTPIKGGVCIHHPEGDIKKISTYDIIPFTSTNCVDNQSIPNNWWGIKWVVTQNGFSVQQPGSSGSPLFNKKKIIGQLFGVGLCANIQCEDPKNQEVVYGKFNTSWDNSSTNEKQLAHWLASENCIKDVQELDGGYFDNCQNNDIYITNPITNKKVFYATNKIVANSEIAATANVEMYANNEIIWDAGFNTDLGAYVKAEIKPCSPTFVVGEQKTIQPKNSEINTLNIFVYPIPTKNSITIRNQNKSGVFKISIVNTQGIILKEYSNIELEQNKNFDLDISNLQSGVYYLKVYNENQNFIRKISKY